MLGLFVFGALVPIGALALFSFGRIVERLNEMRGNDLQFASEQVLRDVQDRMADIAEEVAALTAGAATPEEVGELIAVSSLRNAFRGVAFQRRNGQLNSLLDSIAGPVSPDSLQRSRLAAGSTILVAQPGPPPVFSLLNSVLFGGGTLVFELAPSFLFSDAVQRVSARVENICIVDEDWAPLRCSAPPEPAAVTSLAAAPDGTFARWDVDDGEWLGGYTAASDGLVPGWGVVASASSLGLASAVGDFGQAFLIITVVLLLAVFMFSHVQIRRSLRPLRLLREATAKVADRQFGEPVIVTSGDEFEELARSFNVMAEQVESQFRAMTAMNEIGRSVLSTAKIAEIVDTVLDRAPNIAACDAVIFGLRETGSGPDAPASGGWKIQGRPVGGTQTISATIAPTRAEVEELWNCATQLSIDLNRSTRTYVDLVELVKRGIIYFTVFPIQLKNEVAGVIAIGFTEEPDMQGDNIVRAKRLVDQVTVALTNSELITELRQLNFGTISALARTIDASSPWTAGHSTRVTMMALDIARELRLPPYKIDILHRGGLLHDIGKIGTPPTILNKPGRLDPDELKIMQDHTVVGAKILAPIPQYAEMIPIVRHHHERLDGKGYPDGIGGDDIPFLARVLAVADIFDALISDRPYRAGWPEERVVAEIQKISGTHLDPQCVEAFLTVKAPSLSGTRKSIPYLSVEVDDFYTWID